MTSIQRRVARGAAKLDQVMPGWERKIDTSTLMMSDSYCCIVGQLCGNFFHNVTALLYGFRGFPNNGYVGWEYGVQISPEDREIYKSTSSTSPAYTLLEKAWIEEIEMRLFFSLKPKVSVEAQTSVDAQEEELAYV